MKKTIRGCWSCSNYVRHEHRWKWTAAVCGAAQWYIRNHVRDWLFYGLLQRFGIAEGMMMPAWAMVLRRLLFPVRAWQLYAACGGGLYDAWHDVITMHGVKISLRSLERLAAPPSSGVWFRVVKVEPGGFLMLEVAYDTLLVEGDILARPIKEVAGLPMPVILLLKHLYFTRGGKTPITEASVLEAFYGHG